MLGILSAAIYAENESGDSFIGLMYHQVLKDESRAGKYIITPGELESDLAYLSENGYVSVLPSQLVKIREQGGRLPEKTVVITFDDGYETGLYYVLPLLKKYGMKAVINVVGSYTDEYSRINEEGKHLSYAYLTWNEIKKLSDSGYVEIGNHTYNMHSNNVERNGCARKENESDEQYRTVLYEDVARLSDKLQRVTGKRPVAFAYPFGSLSEGSAEIIGSAGISVFMTCCEQPCSMNRNGRIVINRYNRESGRSAQQICEEFNNAF
ncbi:MAG: polysaccharide deacetylase family protein [Ruminiclostridium sp.]|jgi:hypothetical protein|nr:polysaccharide deacetylase family protein [Ruminiclostridium sp.]